MLATYHSNKGDSASDEATRRNHYFVASRDYELAAEEYPVDDEQHIRTYL